MEKKAEKEKVVKTPSKEELMQKAIAAKCIACQGGYADRVASCAFKDCPLYEYKG